MPPNPPSNSRLPQLAVWSGYGTGNKMAERDASVSKGELCEKCITKQ